MSVWLFVGSRRVGLDGDKSTNACQPTFGFVWIGGSIACALRGVSELISRALHAPKAWIWFRGDHARIVPANLSPVTASTKGAPRHFAPAATAPPSENAPTLLAFLLGER